MATYLVTFDRIGRSRDVAPLKADVPHADLLDMEIYDYARPHLMSRDVEVEVDLGDMTGRIYCGFRNVGAFTVSEVASC